MNRLWTSLFLACAVLAFGGVSAQDVYTLGFSGPDSLSGNDGDTVSADYLCTLTHEGPGAPGDSDGDGVVDTGSAQGWSISLTADGATITNITTAGTDADRLFAGGFEKSETTPVAGGGPSAGDCANRNGAVSAFVLSFTMPRVLPANATSSIAAITIEKTIVEGGSATLRYANGCRGSGQPVSNNITQQGATVNPTLAGKAIACNVVVDCCQAALNYGYSGSRIASENPNLFGTQIADATDKCLAQGGEIEFAPGAGTVFLNIASQFEAGQPAVQGWSVSTAVEGVPLLSATITNTAGAPTPDGLFSGGFEKTETVDPNKEPTSGPLAGAGPQGPGAVSAIVLSFTMPITLPGTGTQSILALNVEGADGDTGRVSLRNGLQGAGQPVGNVITVGGGSGSACNEATAEANIAFRPPPGKGPFVRGDPNDDGRNNIADAIWTINELFRNGPETGCQSAGDANNDGVYDLSDATYIIDYQFLGGPPPPPPFGSCDVEELEEDELPCETVPSSCS